MVGRAEIIDQPDSVLRQKILQIKFENEFAKEYAVRKFNDCLYYQDVEHNSDYIYSIVRVNGDSPLTTEFRKLHQKYDLVMV